MDISGEGALPVERDDGVTPPNLNISDVMDAITRADPLFGACPMSAEAMPRQLAPPPGQPYVRIVEQPAGKALRFRYECEGRSAGSIPGANSTPERRSFPTIEIYGHRGPAIVVVSCVTREAPYKPHPHNLVGREKCDEGVCTVKTTITEDNPQVSFSNLGIQCVKRKDIANALKTRERLRVDPFKTGFNHKNQPQSIDLNAVRLCFQVFIQDERTNRVRHSLAPVVSDIIYDKKALSDLIITRVSHCSGYAKGDTEVILLCERVTKEDVMVVFFQKEGDRTVWEANANVVLVHRQYAVVFQTPPYRNPDEQSHVQVYLQLKRTSDNARSNAIPFEYIPNHQGADSILMHKRRKTLSSSLLAYEERGPYGSDLIKSEPRVKTPPRQSSPRSVFSPPYEQEQLADNSYQQWLNITGQSHMGYNTDMQWQQNYTNLQQLSPNMQASNMPSMASNLQPLPNYLQQNTLQPIQSISPNMQAMSPNMQAMSPNMQAMSPNMQAMSPNMQMAQMSPMGQVMSPAGGISPMTHGGMSPNMGHVSPAMGHVSPAMGHISPNLMQQQLPQQELMEASTTDTPSITGLLMERGEGYQLTSGELSGLSSLLDARAPDLSDSLNRLSTSDLLH